MIVDLISRVRRNHALEHATIHVLSRKLHNFSVQGNAAPNGFYLNVFGKLSIDAIEDAAEDALRRMKGGEHQLAIHPNCGTVLLTSAVMATITGQLIVAAEQRRLGSGRLSWWDYLNILPTAVLGVVIALIVSRPVGMYMQTFTTDGRPRDLHIVGVHKRPLSPIARFFRLLLGQNSRPDAQSYFIETTTGEF